MRIAAAWSVQCGRCGAKSCGRNANQVGQAILIICAWITLSADRDTGPNPRVVCIAPVVLCAERATVYSALLTSTDASYALPGRGVAPQG